MPKILVVDDEQPIRELTKMILEDAGYEVATAENGREAIEKIHVETPDLVLLDMIMPEMTGLEACKILKSKPNTKDIPVTMFTVLDGNDDRKRAKESGCDGYFLKPFTPKDLLMMVKKYLYKRNSSDASLDP